MKTAEGPAPRHPHGWLSAAAMCPVAILLGTLPAHAGPFDLDLATLESNLRVLRRIADEAEIKVLLALKAFSCFAVADLIGKYLTARRPAACGKRAWAVAASPARSMPTCRA